MSGAKSVVAQAKPSGTPAPSLSLSPVRPLVQRKCACDSKPGMKCSCPEEEKGVLQRDASGSAPPAIPSIVHDVLSSPGRPLDATTNDAMSSQFGHDFSAVRIHDDSLASQSARAVNARAYTVGHNIVFAENQYQPSSPDGEGLLAHELAHTIQQSGLQTSAEASHPTEISSSSDVGEREASAAAAAVRGGSRPHVSSHRPVLQRTPWGSCPKPDEATSIPASDANINQSAELKMLLYYRQKHSEASAKHLIANNQDLLETLPTKHPTHGKLIKALQREFHSGKSIIKPVSRVGDVDTPVPPQDVTVDPEEAAESPHERIEGSAPAKDETLAYIRPDILDIESRRVFDVTTDNEAPGKVGKIGEYITKLEEIRTENALPGPPFEAGRDKDLPAPEAETLRYRYASSTPNRIICYGGTDLAVRAGVLSYTTYDLSGGSKGGGDIEPFVIKWGSLTATIDAFPSPGTTNLLSSTPNNLAASGLVPGAILTKLERKKKGGDTIFAEIDSTSSPKGKSPTSIPVEIGKRDHFAFSVHGETRQLKPQSKKTEIAFGFAPMSAGRFTELELADTGLSGKGHIKPSIPMLSSLDLGVAFGPNKFEVISEIPKEKLKPLPGFRVKKAAISLQLAPEFKPSGDLEFEVGPAKKPVADGAIKVTAEGGEFVATADINVKIPGTDEAKAQAVYRPSTGWKGEIHITSSKIPRVKKAAVDVLFDNTGMAVHGGIAVDLPGADNELKLDIYKKGENWLFTGNAIIKVPLPGVDPVDLSFEYDGEKLKGKGSTGVTVRGLSGTITVFYNDGKISGKGTLKVEKGRAKGKLSVDLDEDLKFSGEGEITYQVSENLITTVGIILHKDQSVRVKGAIEFPKPIQLFPPKKGDFTIFKMGVNIPIPGASIGPVGVQARIEGEISAGYAIGPGELRHVKIEAAFNPLDEKPDLDLQMGAQLYIGASASITGTIRGGIALSVAIASVSGGIEVSATATLAGEVLASVNLHYQKSRFDIEADFSVLLGLILTLALNAWARAEAGVGPFTVETMKKWELASFKYDPGLQLGMKLKKKIKYSSDKPFEPPSLDDIEWITPKIDPPAMLQKIFGGSSAKETTKE